MPIGNLNALKPSADIVHWRSYEDGYPLCWPMALSADFESTDRSHEVTCDDCLRMLVSSVTPRQILEATPDAG
jgi:hypothetical protein